MRLANERTRRANDLQRYWQALITNASAEELDRLARPIDRMTIDLMERIRSTPKRRPEPAFVAELERQVMETFIRTQAMPIPLRPAANGRRIDSAVKRPTWSRNEEIAAGRRRRAIAQFGAAMIAVITIAAMYFVLFHNTNSPAIQPGTPGPVASPSSGWTTYKGNAGRTGVTDAGPTGQPTQLWRVQAGAACNFVPAVAGGLVFVPCGDGILYALDEKTGAEIWRFSGAGSLGEVTVNNELVYVNDSDLLRAIDINTGSERWNIPVSGGTSAVTEGGLLTIGTSDGFLLGLDAESGSERWRFQISKQGPTRAPALADGIVYAGADAAGFFAINGITGELLWHGDTGEDQIRTAVVADGIAYIGASPDIGVGHLYAFDATSGDLLWVSEQPLLTPSVLNGIGYTGDAIGGVVAFETASGAELWRTQLGTDVRNVAIAGEYLYAWSDGTNAVYALDANTGAELWNFPVDSAGNSIAVAGGSIYVATFSGGIYAIGGSVGESVPSNGVATPGGAPAESEPVSLLWVTKGGPKPLVSCFYVAVAPNGTIWVIDNDSQYQIFDSNGAYLETWKPTDAGRIGAVGRIAFAPDGGFYVNVDYRILHYDQDRCLVKVMDSQGTEDGQFIAPVQPAVDSAGNLYVGDEGRHDIQVFDSSGTFLRIFAGDETPESQFSGPFGFIAFDSDGNVLVSEEGHAGIRKYAPNGALLMTLGAPDSGPGAVSVAIGFAFTDDGRIIASDLNGGRMVVFDARGNFLGEWGTFGTDGGQFTGPTGVAIDKDGHVYVTDAQTGRVQKFRLQPPLGPEATPVV